MRGRYLALGAFLILGLLFVANSGIRRDDIPGDPLITVEFPATVEAGSVEDAVFHVENPGPGDMDSLFLAFARVGTEVPIVEAGVDKVNPSIVSIDPEPVALTPDAVVFRFEGLAEGEATTITFSLRIPDITGDVANSVVAYAGEDDTRARGIRLSTQVGG